MKVSSHLNEYGLAEAGSETASAHYVGGDAPGTFKRVRGTVMDGSPLGGAHESDALLERFSELAALARARAAPFRLRRTRRCDHAAIETLEAGVTLAPSG